MASTAEHKKDDGHGDSHKAEAAHHATEVHHEVAHKTGGRSRWNWFENMLAKIPHPSKEDFKFGNILQKSKWATVGGLGIGWLHSSILVPALALGASVQFLLNYYLIKPSAPAAAGAHH